ncbi:glycoside hydrolase family 2 [Termitidicoccus mucosus]|uniref:Beta-galactosidase n=1 Tax=Termitidicoccus mucosus TaxID=1184151 RepID=A0A178IKZ2_9BACT|nr:hypothetical protein AW736_08095 [Opitutaceae bacterium TSB47]
MSLDGQWRFALASNAEAADAKFGKFYEASFDSSAFAPIAVPSNWTTDDRFDEPRYRRPSEADGFYLHSFDAPETLKDRRVLLHFDGVWVSAEVWLNGKNIGRHDSGFTSFAFDISKNIKPGKKNQLAVRVRQRVQSHRFDTNDDWSLPGIYRSVWIEDTPRELFIESVGVRTAFDYEYRNATVEVRAMISRNEKAYIFAPSPPFELRATLTRDGKTIATHTYTAATITSGHNGRDVPITLRVDSPAAWTAETPNLYDLRVDLYYHDKHVHTWSDRIGIRDVSTTGGVLRVNGRPVKLRGVNRHDEHPDVGRATRAEHWRQDLELMKAANINTVRCSHYPPAEGFIRLCDEMGMYVLSEIPLGYGGSDLNNPILAEGVYLRLHETVMRDRNRPSIIVWNFGNEGAITSIHLAGLRMLKGLDPTRPVLKPFRADTHLPPEIDILAPHYWSAADYDRLAADSRRPIITTEYSHALGPGEFDFGELEQRFDTLTAHPTGAGGCIWIWADQGLRRPVNGRQILHPMRDKKHYTPYGAELVAENIIENGAAIIDAHGNDGADGIVNADRTPQRDYWETKAVYAPVRFLAERIAFNANQPVLRIPIRNDHDFLDLNTVTFAWTLHRDAEPIENGTATLAAPPHVTAQLEIPAAKITDFAQHVYYADIAVLRADGSEMTRKSVRIGYESTPQPAAPAVANPAAPKIEKRASAVSVVAGEACYEFNTATGEISAISIAGKRVTDGATLLVWRPVDYGERNPLDKRERQYDWDTFMQNIAPRLVSWNIAESANAGAVRITATVEYRADDRNIARATYNYTVTNTGVLRIALEIEPKLDALFIPEAGVEFSLGKNLNRLTWLGYGPLNSIAGKTAATRFGWWSYATADALARGNKWNPDWIRVTTADGASLHVRGAQAARLGGDANGGYTLRVLTHQSGGWTKLFPPERPEWYLDLEKTKKFSGAFEVVPVR